MFYLERDTHAFLTWSTLGGYGFGWIADVLKIPRYVRECNNDPRYLQDLVEKIRRNRKVPPTIEVYRSFDYFIVAAIFDHPIRFCGDDWILVGPVGIIGNTTRRSVGDKLEHLPTLVDSSGCCFRLI